jgi:hypothetical protein
MSFGAIIFYWDGKGITHGQEFPVLVQEKQEHGKRKNKRVCKEATALEENRFSTTSRKANARTSPIIFYFLKKM